MSLELSSSWQVLLSIWIIYEWVLRFVMIYIVPRRKSPSMANGYLLLIMLVPTIGTILFVLFSEPKLSRVRRRQQRTVDAMTAEELHYISKNKSSSTGLPPNETQSLLARLAEVLGGFPVMTGNEVSFHTGYEESINEIVKAISKAKLYVHFEYFILVRDSSTRVIFDELEKAQKRGVKVRVLYDRLISRRYPGHAEMISGFDNAKIEYHPMIPLSLIPGSKFTRPDLRNHRKIVIVDGDVAFTGSQNIVKRNYHRSDDLEYEEIVMKLRGPLVWQLNNVFRSDWFPESNEPLLDLVEKQDLPKKAGNVLGQVLPSGPSHQEENNLRFYTSMVYAAKKRVGIVVPYFVPDDAFLDALTTAAQRGVEVVIINSEAIDKIIVGRAQRSYYEELLQAGVKIYLYDKPVFLHNKQLLIDDEMAIIGSSNLDVRSFALDLELNVIIYDRQTVKTLLGIESKYLQKSTQLTLSLWMKRPFRHKLSESLARITAPLQ